MTMLAGFLFTLGSVAALAAVASLFAAIRYAIETVAQVRRYRGTGGWPALAIPTRLARWLVVWRGYKSWDERMSPHVAR